MRSHALSVPQSLTFTIVVVVVMAGELALAVAKVQRQLYEQSGRKDGELP